MSPGMIQQQLEAASRQISRWKAQWVGTMWGTAIVAVLTLCTLADWGLKFERAGRVVLGFVWMLGLAGALVQLALILRKRRTAQATAALIERSFPQLDNHLINFVQFSSAPLSGTLQDAYLRRGLPEWDSLDLRAMRNLRRYLKACGALVLAVLILGIPCFWVGDAWTRALRRVINPFSNLAPKTIATLVSIQPGNANVIQGEELLLSCKVTGRAGQRVELDLWPTDDKSTSSLLGTLTGEGEEEFVFRFPKVAAALDYRFRAGDAPPSARFSITTRPPLAFTRLIFNVQPPAYTGLPEMDLDGLGANMTLPQGARVKIRMECNQPLKAAAIALDEETPRPLVRQSTETQEIWEVAVNLASGHVFRVTAQDLNDRPLGAEIKFLLLIDKPPAIRVVAPTSRTVLNPGAPPRIQFDVTDDYGLGRVQVQRIPRGEKDPDGKILQEWTLTTNIQFSGDWTGVSSDADMDVGFRVVAFDNRQPGDPNRSVSSIILFDTVTTENLVKEDKKAAADATSTLGKLVAMQTTNLEQTLKFREALLTVTAAQWQETLDRQKEIRRITGELLANNRKPLGTMAEAVRGCYQGEMNRVVDVLERLLKAEGEEKSRLAGEAADLETVILRVLTQAEIGAGRVQQSQAVTGLLALLDAIVKSQQEVTDINQALIKKGAASDPALAQRQDKIAGDFAQFVRVCRSSAADFANTDQPFADLVTNVAAEADTLRIHPDLLTSAEYLETGKAGDAVPLQLRALDNLKILMGKLNAWRTQAAFEKAAEMVEMLQQVGANLDLLKEIQTKVVDAIRQTEHQGNKDTKEYDELMDELSELKAEMAESALKIANDLHVMPELPVGNDLVEDISQVFEEMKQEAGSDKAPVVEQALQKEDDILKLLKMAAGRIDDCEMWLTSKPDNLAMNTESFDKQELKKNGPITLMPLPTKMEDIIGDLLKQQEDLKKKAEDSAANQGSADMFAGWDIKEGQWASYAGKGKSGNEAPDHKEQDGRSGIGREGLSEGEAVGGSGKIGEGDKNIEKRRTKDSAASGKIELEGDSKAKATGGGKEAGTADEKGMGGDGPRRDAQSNQGAPGDFQEMLRRDTETIYAQAAVQHIKTGELDKAIRHMRQAEDALQKGLPIKQVQEFQKRAIWALKATQVELSGGVAGESVSLSPTGEETAMDDQVASVADEAPGRYKDMVSKYYKALGEAK